MPRDVTYPITVLQQAKDSLLLHCNAFDSGYTRIAYHQLDSDKYFEYALKDTDEIVVDRFPDGPGIYEFFMHDDSNNITPSLKIYLACDTDADVLQKIISYITEPEDEDFMQKMVGKIYGISNSYVQDLVALRNNIWDIQDYEKISFYQLISMAERFENVLALTYNRENTRGTVCHYDARFHVTPSSNITSVDLYSVKDDIVRHCGTTLLDGDDYCPALSPDTYYYMNFYCDSELILRLVHYQLDDEGTAYIWSQQQNDSEDRNMLADTQLSFSLVDLTADDKERIIEERLYQPKDFLIERVIVSPSNLDPKILNISIPEANILLISGKDYYISVVERDLLEDKTFDHRYKITGDVIVIDTRKDLIDDEILVCIKNSSGEPVSKYARYHLNDDMSEYVVKQSMVETYEYSRSLLKSFQKSFSNDVYMDFSYIVTPLSHDTDLSITAFKEAIVNSVAHSQKLRSYRDNIIYFIEDDWMRRFNYDADFMSITPRYYYAEGRVVFPKLSKPYWIVVEGYDVPKQEAYKRYYYNGAVNTGVSLPTYEDDIRVMYAIDERTRHRSGFIMFNNMGEKTYHYDAIELEVDIYDG